MEPQANLFFSVKTKRNYEPAVFTKDLFSASLDGYHESSKTMLEIKCPLDKNSSSWKDFFQKNIILHTIGVKSNVDYFVRKVKVPFF